ncbi:MAG: excisionase family DNA-binding protein [Patescibacteria group bacterium]
MNTNNLIRLSISQAASLFGVSTKTIRQAIKNSEITYIIARGRYKLNFESLLNWSQKSTRRRNQLTNQGMGQYVDKWKITNRKYSPRPPD